MSLTTGADVSGVLVGSAGTTSTDGNDTFNATNLTYTNGDVLVGGAGTDELNITATAAVGAATSVVGIEKINVNSSGIYAASYDAAGVVAIGSTIKVANAVATGSFAVTNLGTGAIIDATGVSGALTVTTTASASQSLTLAANTAASQAVDMRGTAAADTATLTAAGTVALTTNGGGQQVETLNLSGNGAAATYTITGTADTYNLTGAQSVTLSGDEASFDGKTVTDSTTAGTTTLKITTSGNSDLSKAAADIIELASAANGHAYTVRPSQEVKITTATGSTVTFLTNDNTATNVTNAALTVDLGVASVGNITVNNAGADKIGSLTIKNSTADQTTTLIATTSTDVTVTGTKALTLSTTSTAKSVSATGLSGVLTVNYDGTDDIATVTGGSGADVFALATGYAQGALTINGGNGNDKITVAANERLDPIAFSSIEVFELANDVNVSFKASQLSGNAIVFTGVNGGETVTIGAGAGAKQLDTATINLSQLNFDANVDLVTIDASDVADTIALGTALTITGSSIADSITSNAGADSIHGGDGDDTISGGDGNDTINGGNGADSITGGDGLDTITTGSGIDIITFGTAATSRDTVTDFTAGTGGDQIKTANYLAADGDFVELATAAAAAFTLTKTNATGHVFEFAFEANSGVNLADGSADSLTGANLLKALNNGTTAATITLTTLLTTSVEYIVAYQGGKAFIYDVTDTSDTATIVAGELALVGILDNVAVGALTSANFIA